MKKSTKRAAVVVVGLVGAGALAWAFFGGRKSMGSQHEHSTAQRAETGEPTLSRGASGSYVRKLQLAIGTQVDGQFGTATEAALKAYQLANNLIADGVAGPDTWRVIHADA